MYHPGYKQCPCCHSVVELEQYSEVESLCEACAKVLRAARERCERFKHFPSLAGRMSIPRRK